MTEREKLAAELERIEEGATRWLDDVAILRRAAAMLRETWQPNEWNAAIEAAADIAKDYNDAAETHIRNLRRQP